MSQAAQTWFITGISRGLGRAFAEALLARGNRVVGTTRDGRSDIVAPDHQLTVHKLDVTDRDAVRATIDATFATGAVDILVNNAGFGLMSSVEGASEAEIQQVMDVNFHGPRHVMQAALPHLRAQRSGLIINISSVAGIAPGAGSGYYAAAKYALEGLSQSLAREVAPLGIRVLLVEPGAFRTDFLSDRSLRTIGNEIDDYAGTADATRSHLVKLAGRQPGDPAKAVAAVLRAAEAANPPLHLVLGPDAITRTEDMLRSFAADLEAWRLVGMSTDHGE